MKRRHALLLGLLLCSCFESPEQPQLDNPFDPSNGAGLPIPDSLSVLVGNNAVRLSWGLPDGQTAAEFAVYRQRLDVSEAEVLLGRVTPRSYLDSGVRNGRTYAYRVSAGRNGKFGTPSEPVQASPGVFSLVIADDAPKTRNRNVGVTLIAASSVAAVRLYEDPDSAATAVWRQPVSPASWTFRSAEDGSKTVYGVFRLQDGSETLPVFDNIVLDTHATIRTTGFTGSENRAPGDMVHFTLDAGESGGTARVDVAGLVTGLELFDNGTGGDAAADNGIYERNWVLPAGSSVTGARITGQFSDDVANVATPFPSPQSLTVHESPDPVTLLPLLFAEPPAAAAITVRWSQSQAADFAAYQIFRSDSAPVDSTERQVGSITARSTVQLPDTDVIEGHHYCYRVYVLTTSGLQTGSVNTLCGDVPNERPPNAVALEAPAAITESSLSLRWTRSQDRDFTAYLVYRNETGTVTETDVLLKRITDVYENYHDDLGLTENTQYYYRVYVEDEGGLRARSDEVSATTINGPPVAVTLLPATDVTSIAATLHWEASTDPSFSLYRLYRSTSRPVNETSDLVVESDERDLTSYTDISIDPATTYYYRLFVVDDDGAVSDGSNTIEVTTPN